MRYGFQLGTNVTRETLHFGTSFFFPGGGPALLFGRRLAGHGVGLAIMGLSLYEVSLHTIPAGINYTYEGLANRFFDYQLSEVQELVLHSLNQHPERYKDYTDAQFNGEWDHTVTLQLVELDQKLSGEFSMNVGDLVRAYRAAAEADDTAAASRAKENLQYLITQKQKEIDEQESAKTINLNRLRVSSSLKRFAERTLKELN